MASFRDTLLQTRSRALARAILISLKGILKEAQTRGDVAQNVASTIEISRKARASNETTATVVKDLLTDVLTKDRIRTLLAKTAELWPEFTRIKRTRKGEQKTVAICWRPLVLTALFTGMRCSELRGLTWDHVDLEARLIRVRQRADFQAHMGAPKSEAGVRDIPIAPIVLNTLRAWKLACPRTEARLVFPTENGHIHSNSNIHKQAWRPLLRAVGLIEMSQRAGGAPTERPLATFHDLRHVAASLFIEQGWAPKKIQTVMGHSSIQVTFDIYGKLFPDAESDQDAMAQLEARLLRPVG